MKKVLFISHISIKRKSAPNGVNIKNRHILEYIKSIRETRLSIIDTYNWKWRVIPLFFQIIWQSLINERIILSIDTHSAYQIIKFANFMKLEEKLIYIVVGGSLHNHIENGSLKVKYFNKIRKIFVQTKNMEEKLNQLGLNNVELLPNSKFFKDIEVDYNRDNPLPIKCFYLGRIHPDKGTDMIFEALKRSNKEHEKFQVDFYGPIEKQYEKEFLDKVDNHSFAKYRGIIDLVNNTNNYKELSSYDLFVFPTFWSGEGFPGVVLDSFISGVPVLASDWNHNTEVVQDGVTGMIFKAKDMEDFTMKLESIADKPEMLYDMRKSAHYESRKYRSENVLKALEAVILN